MANAAAVAATATATSAVGTEYKVAAAAECGMTAAETAVAAMRQELQQSANFYY